jgi:hypothetical protein
MPDLRGNPDEVGFVQIRQGQQGPDPDRASDLTNQNSDEWAACSPEILGSLGVSHPDNTWTMALYFTSEADAREGECYQGPPASDQWFGGPALSASAGTTVLRDAHGLVGDSLNYGSLVDPLAAEGYQGMSGSGQAECTVAAPGTATGAGRSAVRYPDGADTDSNCTDFITSSNPTPGGANLP